MVNIVQTSGYRDPQKAMTIKALEARAKAAQDAMMQSTQLQAPVNNVWQGLSHLTGVLGAGLQERRAESEAAASRGELARLMSGITDYENIDPQVLAQVGALDPEQQRFLTERMLAIQTREDQQRADEAAAAAQRDFTGEQNALQRGSTEGIAARGLESTATLQDQRLKAEAAAAEEAAREAERLAKLNSGLNIGEEQAKVDIGIASIPKANEAREAEALRLGFARGTPEFNYYTTTGNMPPASTISPADSMKPGQAELDKKFAPDALDWYQSGGPNATRAIGDMKVALDLLDKNRNAPLGVTGIIGQLPEFAQGWVNEEGVIARDAVRNTVQQSLKAVLGSQFTQIEGEQLLARAFDPKLGEEENIRRALAIMDQVAGIAANKQEMVKYFTEHKGTLDGYTGTGIDLSGLIELKEKYKGSGEGGGGGGGTYTPPPVDPAIDQEGDEATDTGPNGETINLKVINGNWTVVQ